MKKPSITGGTWSVGKHHTTVVSDANNGLEIKGSYDEGAVDYYGGYLIAESVSTNNAKAIRAVPDMIDALINAHGTLESLTHTGADKFVVEEEMKNIIEALLKAGAEL